MERGLAYGGSAGTCRQWFEFLNRNFDSGEFLPLVTSNAGTQRETERVRIRSNSCPGQVEDERDNE